MSKWTLGFTQIVRLPPSVISLAGTFQRCYVLREVAAPGCVQCSRRVFAECCSLGRVGVSHETKDSNVLAPGAQLDKYAFESCLTLTTITFDMDHTNKPRALCLKVHFVEQALNSSVCQVTFTISGRGPVEVNLMGTEITALLHFFLPRVRTPCGHGAQVIVEGREKQSDGGEKDKDNTTTNQPNQTTANQSPQAESPPSCSLSSVLR